MNTSGIVTMILILGGIWGGFIYCLVLNARKRQRR